MRVYFQGLFWEAQNRRWVLNEAEQLSRHFEVVKAPQDADFVFTFDPMLPDMDAVIRAGKPIVWRIFAGYAKSRIEEVRDRVVLGLINSETKRSDFLRSYPFEPPPPMELVYHPLNKEVFIFQPVDLQQFTYYMYVGMIDSRKRSDWVAWACATVKAPCVMFYPHYEEAVLKEVYRIASGARDMLVMIYNAPPAMVYNTMRTATAIVSASSWETFYIPAIEAAYYGRPLISTELPVLNELWGDTYIKYNRKEELPNLLAMYADVKLANQKGQEMKERLHKHLWGKGVGNFGELAAQKIMEYLRQ